LGGEFWEKGRNGKAFGKKAEVNGIRRGKHCVFAFVTKYRRRVVTKKILKDVQSVFASVCAHCDVADVWLSFSKVQETEKS